MMIIPMELPVKLSDSNGSGKSKMEDSKLQTRISEFVNKRDQKKFKRLYLCQRSWNNAITMQYITIGMSVAESMGEAVVSLFPTGVALMIYYIYDIRCSRIVFTTSGLEPPYWTSDGC